MRDREKMTRLRYGNTNTFLINGLLVDTGCAGTLRAFYRALKQSGNTLKDIRYVLATHYHPDHMGLVGELAGQGVRHLLMDVQKESIHMADRLFERDGLPFVPLDEARATVISCGESRAFLARLGIAGEIIHTPSHSPDSISVILDSGDCLAGDLEPPEYLEAYDDNARLKNDWERIFSFRPKRIWFAHAPERTVSGA